ncbi:MAG: hypothetical protein WAO74_08130 [Polaribacter sp.]|uniref:hypothetical protein n=1 Tax=Polaribacter sp. TaxID=1920175 RepID=UPI003BB1EE3B
MKKIVLAFCLSLIYSCQVKKEFNQHPLLQKSRKQYAIIDTINADTIHKYFKIRPPKNWNIYYDAHKFIIYSPLGTSKYFFQDNDSISAYKNAKEIYDYNKSHKIKKGNYWNNYFRAHSIERDSVKIKNLDDIVNEYKQSHKNRFESDFKYEVIKVKNLKFGEIVYFKYGFDSGYHKITHIDAVIIGKRRIYNFIYESSNPYFELYLGDVQKIINSFEMLE